MVVVRLAENGCLLNQLKKNRENPYINVEGKNVYFSHIDKTRIARDVASGMVHLSNKKVNICSLNVETQKISSEHPCGGPHHHLSSLRHGTHKAACGGPRCLITVSSILQHFVFVLVFSPCCNNDVKEHFQSFNDEQFVFMTQKGTITVTTENFKNKTILSFWAYDSKLTLASLILYD